MSIIVRPSDRDPSHPALGFVRQPSPCKITGQHYVIYLKVLNCNQVAARVFQPQLKPAKMRK